MGELLSGGGGLTETRKRELSDIGPFIRILRGWKERLRGKKKAITGVDGLPPEIWKSFGSKEERGVTNLLN